MHPLYLTMAIDNEDIHSHHTVISRYNAADCEALKVAYFCYHGAIGELIWTMTTCL